MWMDGQYDEVEVEIRMWFISKFESGSFVDPKFFWMKNRTRGLDLWLLDSSSFNFYLHRIPDWSLAVGSFGGRRRAVTAGLRKGPGGD